MADATYEVREIRFAFDPGLTLVYVLCGSPSDGMLGIQGWHMKAFPQSMSALDILTGDIANQAYLAGNGWTPGAPS